MNQVSSYPISTIGPEHHSILDWQVPIVYIVMNSLKAVGNQVEILDIVLMVMIFVLMFRKWVRWVMDGYYLV